MKKSKDSVAAQARYGEIVAQTFGEWDLVHEKSRADYQGDCNFIVRQKESWRGEKFAIGSWTYGSCSGCDSRESAKLSDVEILKEILASTNFLDRAAVKAFIDALPPDAAEDESDYGTWGRVHAAWAAFEAEQPLSDDYF